MSGPDTAHPPEAPEEKSGDPTWFTVTDEQNIFGLPEDATVTFTPNIPAGG